MENPNAHIEGVVPCNSEETTEDPQELGRMASQVRSQCEYKALLDCLNRNDSDKSKCEEEARRFTESCGKPVSAERLA